MSLAVQADRVASLVEALRDPAAYPHPAKDVQVVETHISWVFLAGDYAYKVKKPVRLPFLDFGTLAAREHFCREELRLNRRTAPDLYLAVVPIGGSPLRVAGEEPTVEWAVLMRRFPQRALLDVHAVEGSLQAWHVDALADAVARFHESAPAADARFEFGSAAKVAEPAMANFSEIAALAPAAVAADPRLVALRDWTQVAIAALEARFAQRKAGGFVRECHGDLHLGNAFLEHGAVRLFDCIEFDAALRWTDVMNDAAFVYMDLMHHGLAREAYRFLDRYLERTGDYEGLDLLRFYAVYRAMVRAKVACVRMAQASGEADALDARRIFESYVALAQRLARREAPVLVLMHGVSASGKTVTSQRLLEALGAVRLRSDVERKRMEGLAATARTGAAPGEGLYAPDRVEATYARLEALARAVLAAGYAVVIDATFLERGRRDRFRALAAEAGAAFEIACCRAPVDVLRGRIELRMRKGADASDADLAVLDRQLAVAEALGDDEHVHATVLDTTSSPQWQGAIESFARRFRMPLGPP